MLLEGPSAPTLPKLVTMPSANYEMKLKLKSTRNKYFLARLGIITCSARLWSELRSLGLARPKSSPSHPEISPNQLNSFTSVHLSSSTVLHTSSAPPPPPISDPSVFYFLHITPDILRHALFTCTSNSTGSDNINRRLVMDNLPVTFPIILDLFNLSLNSSIFPSAWSSRT